MAKSGMDFTQEVLTLKGAAKLALVLGIEFRVLKIERLKNGQCCRVRMRAKAGGQHVYGVAVCERAGRPLCEARMLDLAHNTAFRRCVLKLVRLSQKRGLLLKWANERD